MMENASCNSFDFSATFLQFRQVPSMLAEPNLASFATWWRWKENLKPPPPPQRTLGSGVGCLNCWVSDFPWPISKPCAMGMRPIAQGILGFKKKGLNLCACVEQEFWVWESNGWLVTPPPSWWSGMLLFFRGADF